ncbi:type VI secretion system-associated protein TagF [Bordetella sp. 2513F-2]
MRNHGLRHDIGWYGKIPAAGDFMHRRLGRELVAWWDKWLQYGVAALKQVPDGSAERAYATAPIWNFAIPSGPGAGVVQLGCIAPSHDRVGRSYPLCVVLALPEHAYDSSLLEGASDYYHQVGASMLSAVRHGCAAEQLDRNLLQLNPPTASAQPPERSAGSDILEILNAGPGPGSAPVAQRALAGWPDLPFCFNPSSHTSYWWTNQADGAALQTYVHGGALNATLFVRLFTALSTWRL